MERLRLVARAGGSVREVALGAAQALSPVAGNPAALLTACRRLVARKPGSGPLVWLAARALCAPNPADALRQSEALLRADPTPDRIGASLPAGSVVVVAQGVLYPGSDRRPDLQVVVGEEAAVPAANLVLAEATAWGPDGWLAPTGTAALLQQAAASGVGVWAVVGRGVALPEKMWSLVVAAHRPDQWAGFGLDLLAPAPVVQVLGEMGPMLPGSIAGRSDCPVVAELFGGTV